MTPDSVGGATWLAVTEVRVREEAILPEPASDPMKDGARCRF